MATRPQGVKFSKVASAAVQVMTGVGNLYSVFLSWRGVTAGNKVFLYDGVGASAKLICQVTLNEANNSGINVVLPSVGLQFVDGLYYLPSLTAGEMDCAIGYDGNG